MKYVPVAVRLVAGAAAAVAFGFMLYAGSPSEPSWWGGMAIFGPWCLLPYLIVLFLSWRWARSPAAQVLLLLAAAIVSIPAPFILYDAFIANHSSTNALVFVFLPVYQLLVVVPLSLAAWWASRTAKSDTH